MEGKFWIQGEDGKMAGSMHGVAKKGNEAMKEGVLEKFDNKINALKKSARIYKEAYDIARKEQEKMKVDIDVAVKAGRSIKGIDKYYHSVAHCKIARLGYRGQISSQDIGLGKEIYDVLKVYFSSPYIPTAMAIAKGYDSYKDMEANEIGRQVGLTGDPSKSCEELCEKLKP
jgi:hypothetical protein